MVAVGFFHLGDHALQLDQAEHGVHARVEGHDHLVGIHQHVGKHGRERGAGVEEHVIEPALDRGECGPQAGVPAQLLREGHVDPAERRVRREEVEPLDGGRADRFLGRCVAGEDGGESRGVGPLPSQQRPGRVRLPVAIDDQRPVPASGQAHREGRRRRRFRAAALQADHRDPSHGQVPPVIEDRPKRLAT